MTSMTTRMREWSPSSAIGWCGTIPRPARRYIRETLQRIRRHSPHGMRARAIEAYRAAKRASRKASHGAPPHPRPGDQPGLPGVLPPAPNWIPIGPSAVYPSKVAGRVASLAIVPLSTGAIRIYAGTANGGVWRSDDGGTNWVSTMDGLPMGPAIVGSDSLACGAVAVSPADPNKLFVGTGEGHGGSGVYFGVGPMRTDNAGGNWSPELAAVGSLAGTGSAAMAVDPAIPDRVVLASTSGLYRRQPDGTGGYNWAQVRSGWHSSVVVTRVSGVTTFYAAALGGQVFSSNDGATWTAVGAATWPTGNLGNISLGARPTDPTAVYALIAAGYASSTPPFGSLFGMWRLDTGSGRWTQVTGVPASLFGSNNQGWYDNCIAVDPNNPSLIYVGGVGLYRCAITSSGSGSGLTYSMTPTQLFGVHSDVHDLKHVPGDSTRLYVGCDGGVYSTDSANTTATFTARNVSLANLEPYHGDQHPSEDAVFFIGTQDNGTQRYTGDEAWFASDGGDGGAVLINWSNTYEVFHTYYFGGSAQSEDGGDTFPTDATLYDPEAWSQSTANFYLPVAATPAGGTAPRQIAVSTERPWLNTTFRPNNSTADRLPGIIGCMTFASPDLLYVGQGGKVYKYSRTAGTWSTAQQVGTTTLPLPVLSITVDPADASLNSLYVALGGGGTYQHVWHFDGTTWAARSGPGGSNSLIDVQFNALVVDPANTGTLYAGGELGVWRSPDSGTTWSVMSDNLPDAAVRDLKLHAGRRLLRALLHGRGVWEWNLDATSASAVELYMRDTILDRGRYNTEDNAADPTASGQVVWHWNAADIKVDPPSSSGTYQTPSTAITFYDFAVINDGSGAVATVDPITHSEVHNRVYVELHNRGVQPASGVQAMLLLTNASLMLHPLPANYWSNVQSGTAISTTDWQTVGIVSPIDNLTVGFPQVAYFDLHSSMLPPPASLGGNSHFCILALLHCPTFDPFSNTETDVNTLTVTDRKVAQKNLHVVAYTGPAQGLSIVPLMMGFQKEALETELVIDRGGFKGGITVVLPSSIVRRFRHGDIDPVGERMRERLRDWHRETLEATRKHAREGTYSPVLTGALLRGLEEVSENLGVVANDKRTVLRPLGLSAPGFKHIFLAVEPVHAEQHAVETFNVYQRHLETGEILGGSTIKVIVNRKH